MRRNRILRTVLVGASWLLLAGASSAFEPVSTVCTDPDLIVAKGAQADASKALGTLSNFLASRDEKAIDLVKKWFGSGDDTTTQTVKDTLDRVLAFVNAFDFRCVYSNNGSEIGPEINKETGETILVDEIDRTWAYVNSDKAFRVYLFKRFFDSPDAGQDSKLGTLIHEGTHFLITGGTHDSAYQPGDALDLGRSAPSKAIANADSYQYFVEDWLFGIAP